jgi:hypothetical protein
MEKKEVKQRYFPSINKSYFFDNTQDNWVLHGKQLGKSRRISKEKLASSSLLG